MKLLNDYLDYETDEICYELEDRGFKYLLVWKEKSFKMKHLEAGKCPCCAHKDRLKEDCPRFNLMLLDDKYRHVVMKIISDGIGKSNHKSGK